MPRLNSGRTMGHVSRPTHIMHTRPENLRAPVQAKQIQVAHCAAKEVWFFHQGPNGRLVAEHGRSYDQVS